MKHLPALLFIVMAVCWACSAVCTLFEYGNNHDKDFAIRALLAVLCMCTAIIIW